MPTNTQNLFTGFSTVGNTLSKNWTYYDIDLIKRDLMNYFNTRVGERVMRPDFGCKIWDYLMEPLTPGMRDLVVEEVTRVVQSDARLEVQSIDVYTLGAGIRIEATLLYIPFAVIDTFTMDFEDRQDQELGFN